MTVHARLLARLCREKLAAQEELPGLRRQPEQQQAAATAPAPQPTASEETDQPVR